MSLEFSVVEQPKHLPGCCFLCRSTANGPYIDTNLSERGLGVYYICRACLRDMALLLEVVDRPITVKNLQDARAVAFEEGVQFERQRIFGVLNSNDAVSVDAGANDFSVVPSNDGISQESGEPGEGGVSADQTPGENGGAVSGQGPDDLPGDSGDGAGLSL